MIVNLAAEDPTTIPVPKVPTPARIHPVEESSNLNEVAVIIPVIVVLRRSACPATIALLVT